MTARLLDVGGLLAPEPLVRVLEALDTLGPDEQLRVLIDRVPVSLYQMLGRYGYQYRARPQDDFRYEVMIWLVPGGAGL